MKKFLVFLCIISLSTIVGVVSLVVVGVGKVSAATYTITNLGSGTAFGINNLAQVVGETSSNHAFIWDETNGMTDLGTIWKLIIPTRDMTMSSFMSSSMI